MIHVGISEGFHDSAITILNGQNIMSARHGERYTKIKNDPILDLNLIFPYLILSNNYFLFLLGYKN